MTSALPLIAVVDDEASVRTMLRRVLRLGDYEVTSFESGQAFLSSLALRLPACVILDVHLPDLSGFDVQAQLRAMHEAVAVVFITASDDPSLDEIVAKAGGVALLRKPFPSGELLDAVSKAISDRSRR